MPSTLLHPATAGASSARSRCCARLAGLWLAAALAAGPAGAERAAVAGEVPAQVRALESAGRARPAESAAAVGALLAQAAPPALPSLETVAQRLHLSPRTVIRRLRVQGATYQALLDAVLKARAQSLLAEPGMRVQDVAARLGYADSASFRKAFRRWFGVTPAAWRDGAGQAPTALTGCASRRDGG